MYTSATLQHILDSFSLPPRVWIAYSGGLDSHVLLYSIAQLRTQYPQVQFCAVHIQHGLSPHAAVWHEHCQRVCQELGIECVVKAIDPAIYIDPANIEATAREARYQLLAELLSPGDYVVTAHHQDDQAETVLLRLLRGAGPAGLAAMAAKRSLGQRSLGQGSLLRPLLGIPRAALHDYAQREGLVWIEDPSNTHKQFTRNFLRLEVLPLLKSRWPGLARVMARTAQHCRDTQQLADILAEQDTLHAIGTAADTLSVIALRALARVRQHNVLRWWLKQQGFTLPSSQQLAHIIDDIVMAKADAVPLLAWGNVEIRRFEDDLYAMRPLPAHDADIVIPWDMRQPCDIPGIGQLTAHAASDFVGAILPWPPLQLTVQFRRGGELMRIAGRDGSHSLKKLLQEWRVPPWRRDRLPLLYIEGELAAVVGYMLAARAPNWLKKIQLAIDKD